MKPNLMTLKKNSFLSSVYDFCTDTDINKKRNKIFFVVLFILAAVISLSAVFTHEIFRDEAQAWEIAKHVPMSEMWYELKLEGHPILWYLVLKPFAVLGFPCITLNIISWFIVTIANYILLFKINFNNILKIAIIANPFILYWYPVVSRDYVLCYLLLVLLIWFYDSRWERPIRYAVAGALIFSTHIIIFGFGLAIIVVEIMDIIQLSKMHKSIKLKLAALGIEISGLIFLILQLYDSWNINKDVDSKIYEPIDILRKFISGTFDIAVEFLGSDKYTNTFNIYQRMPIDIQFIVGVVFIFIFMLLMIFVFKHARPAVFFYLGVGCIVAVQTIIYFTNIHRTGLIFLLLIFLIKVVEVEPEKPPKKRKDGKKDININLKSLLSGIICVTTAVAIIIMPSTIFIKDYTRSFSSSKFMAKVIRENVAENSTIICMDDFNCESVIAYLDEDYKFYNYYTKEYYTFVKWTSERSDGYNEYLDAIGEISILINAYNNLVPSSENQSVMNSIQNDIKKNKFAYFDMIKNRIKDDFETGKTVYVILDEDAYTFSEMDDISTGYELIASFEDDSVYDSKENLYLYSLQI